MDAHLFRLLCKFICPLLTGARIEKIQEPFQNHLTLSFYKSSRKLNLVCRFGRKDPFAFISAKRPEALPKPTAQIMRLRKYCINRNIQTTVCDVWQRRIWLLIGSGGERKLLWLCLDLAEGAALHFLDESPQILDAQWPDSAALPQALENWRAWPILTPPLRKTMAALDFAEQRALLIDLAEGEGGIFTYANEQGICKVMAWPLPAALRENLEEGVSEDILSTIEKAGEDMVLYGIYKEKNRNAQLQRSRKQKQLEKTLAKLEQDRLRLESMAALEPEARALAANMYQWNTDEKRDRVLIETPEGKKEIRLNNRLTISQNVERMFHTVKRGKRGLEMLEKRRRQLQEEAAVSPGEDARQGSEARIAPASKKVESFWSQDGFLLLRGRDARSNIALRKNASGHDIWVHIENGPGAHVIIRRHHAGQVVPERTLLEAGRLAAEKSWLKDASAASVMYAELRHVKPIKGATPGKVAIDKLIGTRLVPLGAPGGEDVS